MRHALTALPRYELPPLTFTRPGGQFFVNMDQLGEHDFEYSREITSTDLAHVMPGHVDRWDRANYGLWSSHHSANVIPADIAKVDGHAVIAMIADGLRFSMRVAHAEGTTSVYLVGNHHGALWGWIEAAARGDIRPTGNALVHVDHHDDLGRKKGAASLPALAGVERYIENHVKGAFEEPWGITKFIIPAADAGLFVRYLWVYGAKQTAEDLYMINRGWKAESNYRMISPSEDVCKAFKRGAFYCRSDSVPKRLFWNFMRDPKRYVLDVDIDITDEVDDLVNIVYPYLHASSFPGCITIAISPQFGAYENHIQKVMAVLGLIRQRAAELS